MAEDSKVLPWYIARVFRGGGIYGEDEVRCYKLMISNGPHSNDEQNNLDVKYIASCRQTTCPRRAHHNRWYLDLILLSQRNIEICCAQDSGSRTINIHTCCTRKMFHATTWCTIRLSYPRRCSGRGARAERSVHIPSLAPVLPSYYFNGAWSSCILHFCFQIYTKSLFQNKKLCSKHDTNRHFTTRIYLLLHSGYRTMHLRVTSSENPHKPHSGDQGENLSSHQKT